MLRAGTDCVVVGGPRLVTGRNRAGQGHVTARSDIDRDPARLDARIPEDALHDPAADRFGGGRRALWLVSLHAQSILDGHDPGHLLDIVFERPLLLRGSDHSLERDPPVRQVVARTSGESRAVRSS